MNRKARSPDQIAAIVRQQRRDRGLSQAQLGELIGRRQATISKLEKGDAGIQLGTLFDVLAALDLELLVALRSTGTRNSIEDVF
ncbi:helix-turn-helix domain-containing protein [Steroidobacter flavus]|uniref:Helix-turn-helix domain-containing protein n=1 Tax=Steroidobacter flavus TaxID=1842136 RepID=A0ABV8SVP2_9GAMM